VEEIKRQVDAFIGPELVVRGYRDYDIVRVGQEFHAIKQGDGEFSLRRVQTRRFKRNCEQPYWRSQLGRSL
jgi:hypothetical protein